MSDDLPDKDDLPGWLRRYATQHYKRCGMIDYGPCTYCRNHRRAADRIEELESRWQSIPWERIEAASQYHPQYPSSINALLRDILKLKETEG